MSGNRKIIILRAFAKGPHRVEEIVEETEVPQSSVYRIIKALIAEGSLQRLLGRFALTTSGRKKYAGQLEN
ncbi:hypothetical protein LCGC14_1831640 [marine sediment metagenome]|uniref:HVO-A0261-like N-terminal domain-containing protein n=1 Tax=marine sediment metagenome TaxID=412755 RepID=A0A0F9GG68_9ZZZZ